MTSSELSHYIKILEDLNDKEVYSNLELLKKDLLIEFGVKVTIDELRRLINEQLAVSTLEDEIEDIEIMYKLVC